MLMLSSNYYFSTIYTNKGTCTSMIIIFMLIVSASYYFSIGCTNKGTQNYIEKRKPHVSKLGENSNYGNKKQEWEKIIIKRLQCMKNCLKTSSKRVH